MNLYCSQCGKVHAYRRPQAEPFRYSRTFWLMEVVNILGMALLLLVLLFGVPFVLWLVAS